VPGAFSKRRRVSTATEKAWSWVQDAIHAQNAPSSLAIPSSITWDWKLRTAAF
jgi:hypothetical protein